MPIVLLLLFLLLFGGGGAFWSYNNWGTSAGLGTGGFVLVVIVLIVLFNRGRW